MIKEKNGVFSIETENSGYYFCVNNGVLENLHYGSKINLISKIPLQEKNLVGFGSDIIYKKNAPAISLAHLCLEHSPLQKGDYRAQGCEIIMPHGGYTADFIFDSYYIKQGCISPNSLACAYGGNETLCITLKTPEGVAAHLFYTVYEACNVITRRVEYENGNDLPITIKKAMSYQLDLPETDYILSTFTGAWARERHETSRALVTGIHAFGNNTGASGNECNPFFMLSRQGATQQSGEVYGFNLIYSGSHTGMCEVSAFGKTRIIAGVTPYAFSYSLKKGESFATPEAVLTFSSNGKNGMSKNMHCFVNNHIVRGAYKNLVRPILCNNWEATYFDFNEAKIIKMAKAAAKLGIELFVLDDGWFGNRNDDKHGLGDYDVNLKKLPGSLSRLCEKINALGMQFGLWVEPEMVNESSKLYEKHPEWVIKTPDNMPCEGRNQLVLDLCNKAVREYIIENVNAILNSANISYVKWDMNRHISDAYSYTLTEQGRFNYEYIKGLYEIFNAITSQNPSVLFEGCASGGNRFDLGILCYMPQIWASDDTDAYERRFIQEGTSYGYPQSTISCHVSASPNHQTSRQTSLESRFNTACFGVLGYELDLNLLTLAEEKVVKTQIEWYKLYREVLQYGTFYRIKSTLEAGECRWIIVDKSRKNAIIGEFYGLIVPNSSKSPLRALGLNSKANYKVSVRSEWIDIRTFGSLLNHILPVKLNTQGHLVHTAAQFYMLPCEKEEYRVSASMFMNAGIKLNQVFSGTGYNEAVRIMTDFSSRVYSALQMEEYNDF